MALDGELAGVRYRGSDFDGAAFGGVRGFSVAGHEKGTGKDGCGSNA
jgi:hypothetical protein